MAYTSEDSKTYDDPAGGMKPGSPEPTPVEPAAPAGKAARDPWYDTSQHFENMANLGGELNALKPQAATPGPRDVPLSEKPAVQAKADLAQANEEARPIYVSKKNPNGYTPEEMAHLMHTDLHEYHQALYGYHNSLTQKLDESVRQMAQKAEDNGLQVGEGTEGYVKRLAAEEDASPSSAVVAGRPSLRHAQPALHPSGGGGYSAPASHGSPPSSAQPASHPTAPEKPEVNQVENQVPGKKDMGDTMRDHAVMGNAVTSSAPSQAGPLREEQIRAAQGPQPPATTAERWRAQGQGLINGMTAGAENVGSGIYNTIRHPIDSVVNYMKHPVDNAVEGTGLPALARTAGSVMAQHDDQGNANTRPADLQKEVDRAQAYQSGEAGTEALAAKALQRGGTGLVKGKLAKRAQVMLDNEKIQRGINAAENPVKAPENPVSGMTSDSPRVAKPSANPPSNMGDAQAFKGGSNKATPPPAPKAAASKPSPYQSAGSDMLANKTAQTMNDIRANKPRAVDPGGVLNQKVAASKAAVGSSVAKSTLPADAAERANRPGVGNFGKLFGDGYNTPSSKTPAQLSAPKSTPSAVQLGAPKTKAMANPANNYPALGAGPDVATPMGGTIPMGGTVKAPAKSRAKSKALK